MGSSPRPGRSLSILSWSGDLIGWYWYFSVDPEEGPEVAEVLILGKANTECAGDGSKSIEAWKDLSCYLAS
jgi:hypothetical protein